MNTSSRDSSDRSPYYYTVRYTIIGLFVGMFVATMSRSGHRRETELRLEMKQEHVLDIGFVASILEKDGIRLVAVRLEKNAIASTWALANDASLKEGDMVLVRHMTVWKEPIRAATYLPLVDIL